MWSMAGTDFHNQTINTTVVSDWLNKTFDSKAIYKRNWQAQNELHEQNVDGTKNICFVNGLEPDHVTQHLDPDLMTLWLKS